MRTEVKEITLGKVMKKLLVSLLAFLYITSSCEATVYLHYCMGKAVGFSFAPEKSTSCRRCGMKKSAKGMGCCKDEQKLIKSDKNQKITDLQSFNNQWKSFVLVPPNDIDYSVIYRQPSVVSRQPHGPPGADPVPTYLMNCLFRI
jgi:hypothetical protein